MGFLGVHTAPLVAHVAWGGVLTLTCRSAPEARRLEGVSAACPGATWGAPPGFFWGEGHLGASGIMRYHEGDQPMGERPPCK